MRFGVHLFTFLDRIDNSAAAALPRLKELGFEGCEIPLMAERLDLLDASDLRRKLDALGLFRIAGTGIPEHLDTTSENPETRRKGMAFLRRCVDLTAELGAELLTGALYAAFGAGAAGGRSAAQRARSVESLQELCQYALPKGITIGLEPLNRYEHFFINTASEAIALIQEVGQPNLKVHLDTYHMNIEEKNLREAAVTAGELLVHVHASENDRGTPGTGHIDWDGFFGGLAQIGYQGPIVVETFFQTIPDIASFSRVWRRLAPDPETFCRESLAFLRSKAKQFGLD